MGKRNGGGGEKGRKKMKRVEMPIVNNATAMS